MCNISDYINDPSLKPFLIGIGGVSMRSLAETLFANGCAVAGSDFKESETVEQLRKNGIPVVVGHKEENVTGADYIIRSAAIHEDNPEIVAARRLGIPVFERAQGWGAVMQGYQKALCVAGTHGKTSTTSMLTHVALAAETDPTVMIGGDLPILGGGHRVGVSKEVILLESCEYCNSFLHFCPTTAVILNVEADHLDFFKDLDDVKASFRKFALRVPEEDGLVVANADDAGAMDCVKDLPRRVVTFGLENQADYTAENVTYHQGTTTFEVKKDGQLLTKIKLLVPGRHNVLNALACIAAAHQNGMDLKAIADGLESYTGVGRRFEFKGEYGGAMIYDDYAHHPDEIKALFDAVEELAFFVGRTVGYDVQARIERLHAFLHLLALLSAAPAWQKGALLPASPSIVLIRTRNRSGPVASPRLTCRGTWRRSCVRRRSRTARRPHRNRRRGRRICSHGPRCRSKRQPKPWWLQFLLCRFGISRFRGTRP